MTAELVSVRSTPGRYAPEGSATRPVMTPSCAQHRAAASTKTTTHHTLLVTCLIAPPLLRAPATVGNLCSPGAGDKEPCTRFARPVSVLSTFRGRIAVTAPRPVRPWD